MKYVPLLARLAVYVAALVVIVTARLPESSAGVAALRAPGADPGLDPVRILIAAILLGGVVIEFLRRRTVWL